MADNRLIDDLFAAESTSETPLHTMAELTEWIKERNDRLDVRVDRISLEECTPWFLDEKDGCIRNENNSFFQIRGIRQYEDDRMIEYNRIARMPAAGDIR